MTDWMEPGGTGEQLGREQAEEMLAFYCKTLGDMGYLPKPFADMDARVGTSIYSRGKFEVMNHALWMCDQARAFMRQNRLAKAYRWIGMIQGILFMCGVFSIRELKGHNARGVR